MDEYSFYNYKEEQLDLFWAKLAEIYTNIEYNSLLAAQKRNSSHKKIIWGLAVLNAVYVAISFLNSEDMFFVSGSGKIIYIIASLAYIGGLPLIGSIKPQWFETLLGISDSEANKLLGNNEKLEEYRLEIYGIYSKSNVIYDETEFQVWVEKFKNEVSKMNSVEHERDLLTGTIDPKLEKEAQRRAAIKLTRLKGFNNSKSQDESVL